ncbi:MAG: CHAT domain-containing protein, partial [Christensenellaceae bacterium]|nr:CHAT domain-containing protein [Christensenellaceae bacterium]
FAAEDDLHDLEVLPGTVQTLEEASVILWFGHGVYVERCGPVLGTSLPAMDESVLETYEEEIASEQIYLSNRFLCLTPAFFDAKLDDGSLEGSLVYLSACASAQDSRLADVFLKKGAALVVGNTREVLIPYSLYMMDSFMENLTRQYEDGSYYTAEDALSRAQRRYGRTDILHGARVVLLYPKGESGYRLTDKTGPVKQTDSPSDRFQAIIEPFVSPGRE